MLVDDAFQLQVGILKKEGGGSSTEEHDGFHLQLFCAFENGSPLFFCESRVRCFSFSVIRCHVCDSMGEVG